VLFECVRPRWSVPGRLGIAGYGDYEISSEISPKLTTVQSPVYEMGVAAAEMVVEKPINPRLSRRVQDIGYRLMLRESL